jgi:hypothetical protein
MVRKAQALARHPEFAKSAHLLPENERKRIEARVDENRAEQEQPEATSPMGDSWTGTLGDSDHIPE